MLHNDRKYNRLEIDERRRLALVATRPAVCTPACGRARQLRLLQQRPDQCGSISEAPDDVR